MKRWQNIVALGGFLIVLLFVAERFFLVRAPLAGLSWADSREVAHDLVSFGLFILYISVFVLAIVGVFYLVWRGLLRPVYSFLVEKGYLQALVGRAGAPRERSITGRWRHFIEIGIVSVLLAMFELGLTKMNTPQRVGHGSCLRRIGGRVEPARLSVRFWDDPRSPDCCRCLHDFSSPVGSVFAMGRGATSAPGPQVT